MTITQLRKQAIKIEYSPALSKDQKKDKLRVLHNEIRLATIAKRVNTKKYVNSYVSFIGK